MDNWILGIKSGIWEMETQYCFFSYLHMTACVTLMDPLIFCQLISTCICFCKHNNETILHRQALQKKECPSYCCPASSGCFAMGLAQSAGTSVFPHCTSHIGYSHDVQAVDGLHKAHMVAKQSIFMQHTSMFTNNPSNIWPFRRLNCISK